MSEQYTPDQDHVAAYWQWGGRAWQDPAEFGRFIANIKAEARAEGIRDAAQYVNGLVPGGLVEKNAIIADLATAALRAEKHLYANGRRRRAE